MTTSVTTSSAAEASREREVTVLLAHFDADALLTAIRAVGFSDARVERGPTPDSYQIYVQVSKGENPKIFFCFI